MKLNLFVIILSFVFIIGCTVLVVGGVHYKGKGKITIESVTEADEHSKTEAKFNPKKHHAEMLKTLNEKEVKK